MGAGRVGLDRRRGAGDVAVPAGRRDHRLTVFRADRAGGGAGLLPLAAATEPRRRVLDQVWFSIALGLRVLGLNILALLLTVFLPGLGLPIGWAVASWAMGRGLFLAVAMRRLNRPDAEAVYRAVRWVALTQGGVMAAAAYVPFLNL